MAIKLTSIGGFRSLSTGGEFVLPSKFRSRILIDLIQERRDRFNIIFITSQAVKCQFQVVQDCD